MPPAGYFTDDSIFRRVHRESVVALSGPRALLMQAAQPLSWAGFTAHTGAFDAPYERLARTAEVLDTIAFGSRADADRLTRRVRAMHRRVRGELAEPAGIFPAGTPYAADDPPLLLWVLATLLDSALAVYERWVRPLGPDEREAYCADWRVVGRLFGLDDRDMPGSAVEWRAYVRGMLGSDLLHLTPDARATAVRIVMRPPVPLALRPALELANQVTVGLLPERLRRDYGFSWDPVRALTLRVSAEYLRRVVVPLLPASVRVVPSARSAAPPAAEPLRAAA